MITSFNSSNSLEKQLLQLGGRTPSRELMEKIVNTVIYCQTKENKQYKSGEVEPKIIQTEGGRFLLGATTEKAFLAMMSSEGETIIYFPSSRT